MGEPPPPKKLFLDGKCVGEFNPTGSWQDDIDAARSVLKRKGLYREVTEVQAMFLQAFSFAQVAAYLFERDLNRIPRNMLSLIPFVVNSAFSIELYIKTLHKLEGTDARGHKILKLFNELTASTQQVVAKYAIDNAPKYDVVLKSAGQFREFLAELDNAFIEWRYCYESGSAGKISLQPTILVMKAGHEACKELGANNSV